MRGRQCEQCGRPIRSDSRRAIFLFFRPGDREAWVCGRRCLDAYNAGEDVVTPTTVEAP